MGRLSEFRYRDVVRRLKKHGFSFDRQAAGHFARRISVSYSLTLHEPYGKRMLEVACGERKPRPGEPKIWFTSIRSLAEILSDDNRALLRVISEQKPESIATLAAMTHRKPGNLSRTLCGRFSFMDGFGFDRIRRCSCAARCMNASGCSIPATASPRTTT